jgi:hypothetical protein
VKSTEREQDSAEGTTACIATAATCSEQTAQKRPAATRGEIYAEPGGLATEQEEATSTEASGDTAPRYAASATDDYSEQEETTARKESSTCGEQRIESTASPKDQRTTTRGETCAET